MGQRADPSGIGLEPNDAALIRGMIGRGDRKHDIAAFFGVNPGRIAEVGSGSRHPGIAPASSRDLPPPGPYLTPKAAWEMSQSR